MYEFSSPDISGSAYHAVEQKKPKTDVDSKEYEEESEESKHLKRIKVFPV